MTALRSATAVPADQISAIAWALRSPVRLVLLRALAAARDGADLSVPDLARQAGCSEAAVGRQLRQLHAAGAVTSRRHARSVYYRLAHGELGGVLARMVVGLEGDAPRADAAVAAPRRYGDGLTRDPVMRSLLDLLPINIMVWVVGDSARGEPEFTVVLVNAPLLAARDEGLRVEDLEGKDYALVVPEAVRVTTLAALRRVRMTGEPLLGQAVDHPDRQGNPRHYLRSLVPISDSSGVVRLIAGVTMDVTERWLAEKRLAESEAALAAQNQALAAQNQQLVELGEQLQVAVKQRDDFVAMASHELKTPLSGLLANLQLVDMRLGKWLGEHPGESVLPPIRERQHKAIAAARRLTDLVNDLLDVGRIQAGKLDLNVAPCDLADVVREIVEEQREISGRTIDTTWPEGPAIIAGDASRLAQVVTNLLTNALKYSSNERAVQVAVWTNDGIAGLRVRDEGQGIPADELERIFERFHRVQGVRVLSGSGVGLGVGLSITREIVERHGGRIRAESTPGQGATFSVELPLLGEAEVAGAAGGAA